MLKVNHSSADDENREIDESVK